MGSQNEPCIFDLPHAQLGLPTGFEHAAGNNVADLAGALLQIETHVQAGEVGEVLGKISSALTTLSDQNNLDTASAASSPDQYLPQIQQIVDQVGLSVCAADRATCRREAVICCVAVMMIAF